MGALNQEQFLKGINLKDTETWEELYRFFYGSLCNYSASIVMNKATAEDVVQECFIIIWKSDLRFPEIKALSAYLYRSVYNNSLKYLRDKNVSDLRLQRWGDDQDQCEDACFYQAVEEEMIRKMRMTLDKLPGQQQTILLLSIEGLTVQQIAEQLHISANTVKTQKKRAYSYLKKDLKNNCIFFFWLKKTSEE